MLTVILVCIFLSVVLLSYQITRYFTYGKKTILRIKKYINIEEAEKEEKRVPAHAEFKTGLNIISKGIKKAKFLNNYKKTIQIRLNRAHILLKPEEFITVCVFLSLIAGFFIMLPANSVIFAIGAGIAGWIIPSLVLKNKVKKRIKYLNEQLGDAIVLISNSLKAGYSFFQAVETVTREMTGPISEEFSILQKEVNYGLTTEKALENLVQRISSDDLEMVVTAVLIQRQVGGNLAEVLDNISSTIRDRVKIKGEIRTITAQGRMSGFIISLLPPVLGLIIFMINPAHISVLFTNPIGVLILVFSAAMELVGIYFVNRIVKIEV